MQKIFNDPPASIAFVNEEHGAVVSRAKEKVATDTIKKEMVAKYRAELLEYRTVAIAGYPEPVRAWHDGGKVLLVDAANPGIVDADWRKLRDALGPPDARADFRFDVLDVKAGHWIWAARGLAFFLSLGDDSVVRVVQFPPTTAARYLDELELHLGSRERPLD